MNELRTFEISKKRTLIAMQEWLRGWQMPSISRVHCPICKSQKVNKRMKPSQGKIYRCSECHQDFSLEDFAECRCTYPGGLLKCIDCKHYKDMMCYVECRKPQLEHFSEEQLDAIVSTTDFWKRDMERQSPQLQSTQSGCVDWIDTDLGLQLSLFDEDSTKNSNES